MLKMWRNLFDFSAGQWSRSAQPDDRKLGAPLCLEACTNPAAPTSAIPQKACLARLIERFGSAASMLPDSVARLALDRQVSVYS
jgi:hypothetical protein